MAAGIPLGIVFDLRPIPPVPGSTEWFDAGSVSVGLEFRFLDQEIATAAFDETGQHFDMTGILVDDQGYALHVNVGRGDAGVEHLRFDCFDREPHYHYLAPDKNTVIPWDTTASGDMFGWALERLRTRLPEMLTFAKVPGDVIDAIDADAIDEIVATIRQRVATSKAGASA